MPNDRGKMIVLTGINVAEKGWWKAKQEYQQIRQRQIEDEVINSTFHDSGSTNDHHNQHVAHDAHEEYGHVGEAERDGHGH